MSIKETLKNKTYTSRQYGVGEFVEFRATTAYIETRYRGGFNTSLPAAVFRFEDGRRKAIRYDHLDSVFIDLDDETLEEVRKLQQQINEQIEKHDEEVMATWQEEQEHERKLDERRALRKANFENILGIDTDENGDKVSPSVWKNLYDIAEEPRDKYESRAVISNDGKLFVNASAALVYFGQRAKDGDKLYDACQDRSTFHGRRWRYATKEQIAKHLAEHYEIYLGNEQV